jgi:hypothetical protein
LVVEVELDGERIERAHKHGTVEAGDGDDVGAQLLVGPW